MDVDSGPSGYSARQGVRRSAVFLAVMSAGFLVTEGLLRILGLAQDPLGRVVQVLVLAGLACVLIALQVRAVRRRDADRLLPPPQGPPDGSGLAPPFFLGSLPALGLGALFALMLLTSGGDVADRLLWGLLSLAFVGLGVMILLMGAVVRVWVSGGDVCFRPLLTFGLPVSFTGAVDGAHRVRMRGRRLWFGPSGRLPWIVLWTSPQDFRANVARHSARPID